jgi:hypothetical protein
MRMRRLRPWAVGAVILLAWPLAAQAGHGGVFFGLNLGVPLFYPGFAYPPYPVYVAPPPVVYQPAPVVYQPVPVAAPPGCAPRPAQPACNAAPAPTIQQTAAPPLAAADPQTETTQDLQRLADPDERVRAEAAIQLGRRKAERAADPLAATLAGDRSPQVRETAARALALIGSPRALPALRHAALADGDPTVRHTAEFAAEVVQAGTAR